MTTSERSATDERLDVVADFPCQTGERPTWHAAERCLYWTDIPGRTLYRYSPTTAATQPFDIGRQVGGFTVQADGSLLLFMDRGGIATWRDGQFQRTIIDSLPEELDNRFNDVIADPRGRVFCGTMSIKDATGEIVRYGKLYRLDIDGTIRVVINEVGTSNGLGFTLDERGMYHTDTRPRTIWRYDYEIATGVITNRRPVVEVPASPTNARPDGLAIDTDGNLWSAHYDGGCVVKYAPSGQELARFSLPTPRVTCAAFGGERYDQLYITTGGGEQRAKLGPAAGALFCWSGVGRGKPDYVSRIGLE